MQLNDWLEFKVIVLLSENFLNQEGDVHFTHITKKTNFTAKSLILLKGYGIIFLKNDFD